MGQITNIKKQTDNKFLNIYELENVHKSGKKGKYYVASRAKDINNLKLNSGKNYPDGVIIYALAGENKDKIVLIRQYRYSINDYIYEFPAGLVEEGEDYEKAADREIFEETGMRLTPISVPEGYNRPFFTTIGMTDESCSTVFGYCIGNPSSEYQEDSEEIEVVLADRNEVRRILKEEKIAIMTAYMLMHFVKDEEPFSFLKED
nr:NUDIX hydrolase [uncultured Catonella sp.]